MREVATVGVVGTGVIGAGWAARCLASGLDVLAWDPAPDAEERLRAAVDNAWPALTELGLFPGADPGRLFFHSSLEALVDGADFIQESAPERLELKTALHAQIDALAAPEVVVASSTSGLLPSHFQSQCRHPQRILVGHPFNPVYLLPLVEVVAGRSTGEPQLDSAVRFYRSLGMYPLRLRREIEGFLSDRLQEALWRENLHLINEGIASTDELDAAICYGPGLRWAMMGVNMAFFLAGGDAGMRHFLEQFGPALELPWTRLEAPPLSEELIERMVAGTQAQAEGRSVKELERLRDQCLIAILRALREYDTAAGRVLREQEVRRQRAASSSVD